MAIYFQFVVENISGRKILWPTRAYSLIKHPHSIFFISYRFLFHNLVRSNEKYRLQPIDAIKLEVGISTHVRVQGIFMLKWNTIYIGWDRIQTLLGICVIKLIQCVYRQKVQSCSVELNRKHNIPKEIYYEISYVDFLYLKHILLCKCTVMPLVFISYLLLSYQNGRNTSNFFFDHRKNLKYLHTNLAELLKLAKPTVTNVIEVFRECLLTGRNQGEI